MRISQHFKILTVSAVLLAIAITSFIIISTVNEAKSNDLQISVEENFKGNSEFYFKAAGDDRIWHVINRYSSKPNEVSGCNNSEYIFSKDSVTVVNEFFVVGGKLNIAFN